jgi:hypothetical protein
MPHFFSTPRIELYSVRASGLYGPIEKPRNAILFANLHQGSLLRIPEALKIPLPIWKKVPFSQRVFDFIKVKLFPIPNLPKHSRYLQLSHPSIDEQKF